MKWYEESRPQESLPPEVSTHRARKDRRRWCKGKVGREHVVDQLLKPPWARCHVSQYFRHPHGQQLGTVSWSCWHTWACSACGKHLEPLNSRQCPDRPAVLPAPRQHPYATRVR